MEHKKDAFEHASAGGAKEVARWIALGALFLIPVTPLIVANQFFFPFITGKAFYFRILVEVAVVAWGALALLDKRYRPRFSWIAVVMVVFVAWMFVADFFAVNVAKAFWSNFERMEGWILLIHLLGFFFAAGAVLRVEKKWRAWFLTSLTVSLVIAMYGLLQLNGSLAIHQGSWRIDATLGNSAYLAIYFLFNVFIALWLALTEKYSWLKWSFVGLAALEAILIFFTETRGTIIGLVFALSLASLLFIITGEKRERQFAAGTLAIIIVVTGGLYFGRNSDFVQHNYVLHRIASIAPADGATRFAIWHMAFRGVMERPVFGWGQEGFNYIFNKYYDPSIHDQEPWFDRAHNAFIDWLTAGGFPALLLFLSLFGSAIYLLWKRSELSHAERIMLTSAFVGYAVHNLFVFDNLSSYMYFFALLALIDSQVSRPIARIEEMPVLDANAGTTYVLPMATVTLCALIWFVNVPGMSVADKLITALTPSSNIATNQAVFEDLVAHPAFAAQEIREQLINFATAVAQSSSATNDDKQKAVALAITEMQKQVNAYPSDVREVLELSYIYRAIGDGPDALKAIEQAKLLSPKKEDIWVQAGAINWDLGNYKEAQQNFATAYALGPQFSDLAEYAAAGDVMVGDIKTADTVLLQSYGTTTIDSDILSVAYYKTQSWQRLLALWKLRTKLPSATADTWFGLASVYYSAGDMTDALATVHAAVALFPDAADKAASAISQIQDQAKKKGK